MAVIVAWRKIINSYLENILLKFLERKNSRIVSDTFRRGWPTFDKVDKEESSPVPERALMVSLSCLMDTRIPLIAIGHSCTTKRL